MARQSPKPKRRSRRVTLTEVARACGVSIGTASEILSSGANAALFADSTRRDVLATARRLGYVPNMLARRLRTSRTHTIGVIVARHPAIPSMAENFENLERHASQRGYRMQVGYTYGDVGTEAQLIREFRGLCVDGMIITPAAPGEDDGLFADLDQQGFPLVTMDCDRPVAAHNVSVDRELGGYLQVRHLLEIGRRQIVFVVPGAGDGGPSPERFAGHARALAEAGLALDERSIVGDKLPSGADAIEHARTLTTRLLASGQHVDAIVTHDDHLSIGVLEALLDAGRRVPEDVALVSYDDDFYARALRVPLTTIRQPRDLATTALSLLLSQIDGTRPTDPSARRVRLEPRLVIRESTVKGAGRGEP